MDEKQISAFLKSKVKNTTNPLMDILPLSEFDNFIKILFNSKDEQDILDIGGGRGKTFDFNKKNNYYVLDINCHNDKSFIQGDITNPNLNIDKKFDFIISKDTFEHILNPWDATQNILKLLKEGGIFICETPFNWRFHPSPYDGYRYSHQGLKYLFEQKDQMREISSGYIYFYNKVSGFWNNKCDWWPFSQNKHTDCVCSYYIGIKDSEHKFDISHIRGDFSSSHLEIPK